MKILYFINALGGGGAERVLSMLANAHSERNDDVYIATNLKIPIVYNLNNKIRLFDMYDGIPETENDIYDKIYRYIKKISNIRHIAKQVNPDVAISFLTELNHDVIFSLIGTGIPLVCSEHTNVSHKLDLKTSLCRRLMYPFASAITVLTNRDLKIWKREYKNVVRMPNPCFCHKGETNAKRKKIVLAIGEVNRWEIKGFDTLLKAWGSVCPKHPDWELNIAGAYNTESYEYLNNIAIEYKCINYKFLGFRKDVAQLLKNAEVFVLSSRYEGLPMALIEAMDAGCCCISFDVVTGPSDIIQNNKNGILVKDQNLVDLANSIDRVLSNNDERLLFSSMAPLGVQKFDIERILDRWDILFKLIIKK